MPQPAGERGYREVQSESRPGRGLAGGPTAGVGLLLAAAAATACATAAPKFAQPTVPVPAAWTQPSLATGLTALEPSGDLSRWWEQLGDATLSDLIEKALVASPDLRSAQARLRESRARRSLAGKGFLPSLTASASGSSSKSSGESGSGATRAQYDAAFDASWEPDVFGATRSAVSAAQADLETSAASLHDTQVSLVAELARDYTGLRAFQARLAIARDNLARQAETLNLTVWRAQAGLTSSLHVEQARANLEQTRAQIPGLETDLAESEHRLAILLGRPPGALHDRLGDPAPIPVAPEPVAIGIPADTLRQRPDVRAAERQLAAETARLGEAKAALYPRLKLSASIGLEALTLGGLTAGGAGTRSLIAGLTAPIFDGGRIRLRVDAQDAVRERALIAYEKTVLSALADVENALVALANSRRRQEALAVAAQAIRDAALLARHRYTTGLTDFQAVLDTERSALSIEDGLKASQAESTTALIRLYKALGGGWSEPRAQESSRKESE